MLYVNYTNTTWGKLSHVTFCSQPMTRTSSTIRRPGKPSIFVPEKERSRNKGRITLNYHSQVSCFALCYKNRCLENISGLFKITWYLNFRTNKQICICKFQIESSFHYNFDCNYIQSTLFPSLST